MQPVPPPARHRPSARWARMLSGVSRRALGCGVQRHGDGREGKADQRSDSLCVIGQDGPDHVRWSRGRNCAIQQAVIAEPLAAWRFRGCRHQILVGRPLGCSGAARLAMTVPTCDGMHPETHTGRRDRNPCNMKAGMATADQRTQPRSTHRPGRPTSPPPARTAPAGTPRRHSRWRRTAPSPPPGSPAAPTACRRR